jgi:RNA polymerase sigma-70 factor, ECF subfamily
MTNTRATREFRSDAPSPEDGTLAATLKCRVTAAQRRYPSVRVDEAAFIEFLAQRVRRLRQQKDLQVLHVEDLFLVFGCLSSDRRALGFLEQRYLKKLRTHLARAHSSEELAATVLQSLRTRLLISETGGTPKLALYSGQGPLWGWLKVVASRLVVDTLRAQESLGRRRLGDEGLESWPSPTDVEQEHLQAYYRKPFKHAVEHAVRLLPERDRALLHSTFVEGMTPEYLGRRYGVHRTTIRRWLAAATTRLTSETRGLLAHHLRMETSELDGLVRILSADPALSLNTAFALLRT